MGSESPKDASATEFYNQCHGEGGRFCSEKDGKPISGKMAWHDRDTLEPRYTYKEDIPVDGHSDKTAPGYVVQTGSGLDVTVVDPEDFAKDHPVESRVVMDTVADLHEIYSEPSYGPEVVFRTIEDEDDFVTSALVDNNTSTIHFNTAAFPTVDQARDDDGYFMPMAKRASEAEYISTHEYGHLYDLQSEAKRNRAGDRESIQALDALIDHPKVQQHLSRYGRDLQNPRREAYAEAFAEWHTSRGTTDNVAAKALAIQEKWEGADKALADLQQDAIDEDTQRAHDAEILRADGGRATESELAVASPSIRRLGGRSPSTLDDGVVIIDYKNRPSQTIYGKDYKHPAEPTPEQRRKAVRRAEEILALVTGSTKPVSEASTMDLLSFAVDSPPPQTEAGNIWATLRQVIEQLVTKDGIRKDAIQLGQIEADVYAYVVDNIYHDVAEFYAWWFNKDDDRTVFIGGTGSRAPQKKAVILAPVRAAVQAVVQDNLEAMREVGEIPEGQDTDRLPEMLTDSLSRYIANWEDWCYARKQEEEIDNYFEQKSIYEDIYFGTYGDLTNILDGGQFDGFSDVPYIAEP